MAAIKITDHIDFVGTLNPNMRIFDIVMETEYGTSYNAYLVKGTEKTALIETTHLDYFDVLIENIVAAGVEQIDYIVLNHTEPDHSGALALLSRRYPNAQIICSKAAGIYLKGITNAQLQMRTVKDADELDLGGRTLHFINAPFLHWPDSMFTYCPEENVLFTCDFLGAHYCEPRMFSSKIAYPHAYESAFKNYYDAIFGPFQEYVLKGLDKIQSLSPDYICTSHGPILTGEAIEKAKEQYRVWSTPVPHDQTVISVFYASAYGCTKMMAEQIGAGIISVLSDALIELYNVNEHSLGFLAEKLAESDAFLVGCPTINKDAVAPIWDLLARIDAIHAPKKTAAAFGSFGWSGEAVPMLTDRLRGLKIKVPSDGLKICFVPSEEQKKEAFDFGKMFAETL